MISKTNKQRNFDKRIGRVLRRYRKARKMSMQQVGESLGVSAAAYYRYETGEATIGLARLISFADTAGASIYDIIGEAAKRQFRRRTPRQERIAMLLEKLPEQTARRLEILVIAVAEGRGSV